MYANIEIELWEGEIENRVFFFSEINVRAHLSGYTK